MSELERRPTGVLVTVERDEPVTSELVDHLLEGKLVDIEVRQLGPGNAAASPNGRRAEGDEPKGELGSGDGGPSRP